MTAREVAVDVSMAATGEDTFATLERSLSQELIGSAALAPRRTDRGAIDWTCDGEDMCFPDSRVALACLRGACSERSPR